MRRIVTISLGLLLLVGCGSRSGKVGVVSGKITYKGQPVNNAALQLYPTSAGATDPITIPVTGEGTFRITDVPPGEYKIVVQGSAGATQASPSLAGLPPDKAAEMKEKLSKMNTPATIPFPDKYKNRQTTNLKCNVTQSDQTLNLELTD